MFDVGVNGEVLGLLRVRQLPFDEDQIHERTCNCSDKRRHQGHPEPVVVTAAEEIERHPDETLEGCSSEFENVCLMCPNIILRMFNLVHDKVISH